MGIFARPFASREARGEGLRSIRSPPHGALLGWLGSGVWGDDPCRSGLGRGRNSARGRGCGSRERTGRSGDIASILPMGQPGPPKGSPTAELGQNLAPQRPFVSPTWGLGDLEMPTANPVPVCSVPHTRPEHGGFPSPSGLHVIGQRLWAVCDRNSLLPPPPACRPDLPGRVPPGRPLLAYRRPPHCTSPPAAVLDGGGGAGRA